jgi:hypothetical protein
MNMVIFAQDNLGSALFPAMGKSCGQSMAGIGVIPALDAGGCSGIDEWRTGDARCAGFAEQGSRNADTTPDEFGQRVRVKVDK